jgi:hypothetical protein
MKTSALLLVTVALAGCASIRPAELALPEPLAGIAPTPLQGLGAGRSGSFTLGADSGRFQRERDRLSLFEVLSFDRAPTRYELRWADGRSVQAACVGRQTTATLGVLSAQPQAFTLRCEWAGSAARLELTAPSPGPGARAERSGRYVDGGLVLALRSVHQARGSSWPLAVPLGYLISHEGRPVGAVEINGTVPRLWRPAPGTPLHEAVTQAALALALLWDPAAAE